MSRSPLLSPRVLRLASLVHARAGAALVAAKRATGRLQPLRVHPYVGYGTPTEVRLKGRVLEESGALHARATDTAWHNLVNMARRFTAAPIPRAALTAGIGGAQREVAGDAEGYFRVALRPDEPLAPGWHDVTVTLRRPLAPRQRSAEALGRVLVPAPDADFGVISDLDDTVMRTGLTSAWLTARIVLFNNARTRTPFDGVADFYAALQAGPEGRRRNPLFYVSSSPWNLFDLVMEFLELNRIPAGPLFLRAWGLDADALPGGGHHNHKSERIQRLLDAYPGLAFVLIGDSGQEDPEIYRDVALASPQRIRAIYIRDVTTPERDREVHAIAAEVQAAGVPFVLVAGTAEAAAHAAAHGLITAGRRSASG